MTHATPLRLTLLACLAGLSCSVSAEPSVERGRYLVQVAGCNDCHTAGYVMAPDKVPEAAWLQGDQLGWSGPWGTTYASNLRLLLPQLSEEQWLQLARQANYRPPMPSHVLRVMDEDDLRSIHRFVKQLGVGGAPAPAALPPGQVAKGPVVQFPMPPAQP
ncbi:cytochrome C [Pseudomonas alcaligenes]|uniref:Cytochrome C n=1 Tax=Aquipseudomonas alcaligenes TaxID=43263 RepID=A0ABR7S363_AQUAC|nr:cytochrome C [Pseudomonas alcaligenes]MBC9250828.1 cytochrome C [Pseudomonas alcaligenes]